MGIETGLEPHSSASIVALGALRRLPGPGESWLWKPYTVTGVTWSPKVFEVVRHHFVDEAIGTTAGDLDYPFELCLSRRHSRVSDRFTSLDFEASGVIAQELSTSCSSVFVYRADYTIPLDDGTLNISRITGLELIGTLMQQGQRKPMLADELTEKRRHEKQAISKLRQGDPFSEDRVRGGRGRAHSARGRGRLGRGRGGRGHDHPAGRGGRNRGRGGFDGGPGDGAVVLRAEGDGEPMAPDGPEIGEQSNEGDGGDPAHDPDALFAELDLEEQLANIISSDEAELFATFEGHGASCDKGPAAKGDGAVPPPGDQHDVDMTARIFEAAQVEAAANGLGAGGDGQGIGGSSSSSGAIVPPPPPPPFEAPILAVDAVGPPEPEPGPQDCAGPTPLGYMLCRGTAVARLIRGKPAGSMSFRCYRHPSCSFVVSLAGAPTDEELIEYLFSVRPALANMPPAERKALAKEHMDLAKKCKAKPKAKAKAGA